MACAEEPTQNVCVSKVDALSQVLLFTVEHV